MGESHWTGRPWSSPLADPAYRSEVWDRLLRNVEVMPNGCWHWLRYRSPDGYGVISVKRIMTAAHQVALAISIGGVWEPPLQVDHLCRNRICCNPDHLDLVTPQQNTLRGRGPQVTAERRRAITHCPKGHAYDESNTYYRPPFGHRTCRACRREGMRRAYVPKR